MKRTPLQRKQFNIRVSAQVADLIAKEIKRQGRKRDAIGERILRNFLNLKLAERERICAINEEVQ